MCVTKTVQYLLWPVNYKRAKVYVESSHFFNDVMFQNATHENDVNRSAPGGLGQEDSQEQCTNLQEKLKHLEEENAKVNRYLVSYTSVISAVVRGLHWKPTYLGV